MESALHILQENPGFDFVLKGRGFSRAVSPGGWPALSLISTPEGAPSLSRFLRQGGDFDFLSPPRLPSVLSSAPSTAIQFRSLRQRRKHSDENCSTPNPPDSAPDLASPDYDAYSGPPSSPGGASKLSPALQRGVACNDDPSPVGTTETRTPAPGRRAPPNGDERLRPAIAAEATSRKAREVAHPQLFRSTF